MDQFTLYRILYLLLTQAVLFSHQLLPGGGGIGGGLGPKVGAGISIGIGGGMPPAMGSGLNPLPAKPMCPDIFCQPLPPNCLMSKATSVVVNMMNCPACEQCIRFSPPRGPGPPVPAPMPHVPPPPGASAVTHVNINSGGMPFGGTPFGRTPFGGPSFGMPFSPFGMRGSPFGASIVASASAISGGGPPAAGGRQIAGPMGAGPHGGPRRGPHGGPPRPSGFPLPPRISPHGHGPQAGHGPPPRHGPPHRHGPPAPAGPHAAAPPSASAKTAININLAGPPVAPHVHIPNGPMFHPFNRFMHFRPPFPFGRGPGPHHPFFWAKFHNFGRR